MARGSENKRRAHRSYKPAVEAMEVLRLLSGATATVAPPAVAAEHNLLADPPSSSFTPALDVDVDIDLDGEAWAAALLEAPPAPATAEPRVAVERAVDPEAAASGLNQLNRYLSRSWHRAGLPPRVQEDCTQAVYAVMLGHHGRDRFDSLLGEVGVWGVREVFSRDTAEGVDFFRAVDMVKKRAQRERVHQPLDAIDVAASSTDAETEARRASLREAIDGSLSPREALLIQETLLGRTPAEIAQSWGVAPKTISNEKSRVIQKLRDALQTQAVD